MCKLPSCGHGLGDFWRLTTGHALGGLSGWAGGGSVVVVASR